jgi:hypothetical protein
LSRVCYGQNREAKRQAGFLWTRLRLRPDYCGNLHFREFYKLSLVANLTVMNALLGELFRYHLPMLLILAADPDFP